MSPRRGSLHWPTRIALLLLAVNSVAVAQPLGDPDRGQPGDRMIQNYLLGETEKLHARFTTDVESLDAWEDRRAEYKRQYLYMLGLWPTPNKTPLRATVTGTLRGDGYVVDMLHYQSKPRLYVTANLYRPAKTKPGERLPAILYVCGHSGRGRDGNKTAYQSHGMWFARHGYVCLVLDTLQLGEIAATHHGTYREQRWWWHARGYTSAGVECWNGVRGIDYLISRSDVDAARIAVTGISGGGAATFWIAAADERAKVAVPVSGMADLPSYVPNRVINGHCDCMFLYNTYQWPWTRIAALIAPRPLLFVNSDDDRIFPMDANERVVNRLERLYSLYGAGDSVDTVVSVGGHAYRKDLRKAIYRHVNTHLKNDPREVADSEVDLVGGSRSRPEHPIDPSRLRVFPHDSDIPADQLNTTIDQHFVPIANVALPVNGQFDTWKASLVKELREVTFRSLPQRIAPAKPLGEGASDTIETETGIRIRLQIDGTTQAGKAKRILLVVAGPATTGTASKRLSDGWFREERKAEDLVYRCDVRGVGSTRWTQKNPPNYVQRSHVLLGRTVDTGRIQDVAAAARYLRKKYDGRLPVYVIGEGRFGAIGAHAAVLESDISGAIVANAPRSYMSPDAPRLLNAMRVCDLPDVLGMLAPKPLTLYGDSRRVAEIYSAAGAEDKLTVK